MDRELFDQRRENFVALGVSESQIDLLWDYIETLWAANSELNLFSRKMPFSDLIDNHVIDCLLPSKHFPREAKLVADFGTGGGLPGLLYAIQFPDIQFRLYEKSRLKQKFLEHCRGFIPNIKVLGEIPKALGLLDLAMSRAFKPTDVLIEMSRDYFDAGGKYFLFKGRLDKTNEELALAKKKFKGLKAKIVHLESPVLEVERNLLLINF